MNVLICAYDKDTGKFLKLVRCPADVGEWHKLWTEEGHVVKTYLLTGSGPRAMTVA